MRILIVDDQQLMCDGLKTILESRPGHEVCATAGNGAQGDPGASQEVTEEVLRLEVAKSRRDARDAAQSGDFGTASRLLSGGADLLAFAMGMPSEVEELRRDAAALQEGRWSAAASKRQFSRSRSTHKGRRTDYETPEEPA